jgi:excinuclease UvrABC nuclease subunit
MKWSICYSYTRTNVRIYAPISRGIYRLLIKNRIFYIGQSENLRNRLLEHRQVREGNRRLKKYLQNYSCFFRFAELDATSDLLQTERDQILKYKPFCNVAEHPPVVGRWRKLLPSCPILSQQANSKNQL